jgi:hypothetical protein
MNAAPFSKSIVSTRNLKILGVLALSGVAAVATLTLVPDSDRAASEPKRLTQAVVVVDAADAAVPAGMKNGGASRLSVPDEIPTRGALAAAKEALWRAQSWLPPTPVNTVAATRLTMPPPPAPPALHYRYAGQVLRDGQVQVFVAKDDTTIAVKLGDSLDGYVVESIAADVITLVYPPLGNKAIIAISPAQSL